MNHISLDAYLLVVPRTNQLQLGHKRATNFFFLVIHAQIYLSWNSRYTRRTAPTSAACRRVVGAAVLTTITDTCFRRKGLGRCWLGRRTSGAPWWQWLHADGGWYQAGTDAPSWAVGSDGLGAVCARA